MNDTVPTSDVEPTVTELQAEVLTTLAALKADADLIHSLVSTHQRGLGFLTPEARKILDAQLQADRKARRTQPDRVDDDGHPVTGLDWLNRDTHVAGTGYVRAAATVSAVTVDAEISFTLHDLIRQTTSRLERAGLCSLYRLKADPTTAQLFDHFTNLVRIAPSPSLQRATQRELDHLVEAASLVIDGNDRTSMEDPCPHCGRHTLVVYFRDGVIRCDRDPHTSQYAPCQCEDRYCDCKRTPVSFRHAWYRSRRLAPKPLTAHDWHDLASRLNIHRATQKETCP